MPRLYLIRHGHVTTDWAVNTDPSLDATGIGQAEAAAALMLPIGPLPLVVSPAKRTRETAEFLEKAWQIKATVDQRVAELPSPGLKWDERVAWIGKVVKCHWPELDGDVRLWRQSVLDCLMAVRQDTVVVTHLIAINVAVGAATEDDRVVIFRPLPSSCTIVEQKAGALRVIELGQQGESTIA